MSSLRQIVAFVFIACASCTGDYEPALHSHPLVEQALSPVASCSLINAGNAQPISGFNPIAEGTTLTLTSLPTQQVSIAANPNGTVGSIVFVLDGAYTHTENVAPYSLCGDATTSYTACPQLNQAGAHTLTVTSYSAANAAGSAAATLTLHFTVQATSGQAVAPTITTPPAAQSAVAGQTATFFVVAAGTAPLAYQWLRNGTAISGATGTSYTTAVLSVADNGAIFSVTVSDAVGSVTSASAALRVSAPSSVAFPLRVNASGRYLEDQHGTPFPILGDAGWEAVFNLSTADQKIYFDDRTARGFNAILLEAIEHKFTANKPPKNFASILPFTQRLDAGAYEGSPNGTTSANGSSEQFAADPYSNITAQAPDFTSPNGTYWSQLDAFITQCNSRGVEAFVFPAYVGYAGADEGWMSEMVANDAVIGAGSLAGQAFANPTKSKLWNYGAWLATHFKATTNIIWVLGGDFGTTPSGTFSTAQQNAISNLLAGMKSVSGQQSPLWTSHWGRPSLGTDVAAFAASLDLESVYENTSAASEARNGYAHAPAKPAFELEDEYEGSNGATPDRSFQWWSFLGDIAGQFYSNEAVWPFASGWQNNLSSPGAQDMAKLNAFIRSIAWQTLVPSGLAGTRNLVTINGSAPTNADYIACAQSSVLAVCYVPAAWALGTFTIDATVLSTAFRARWLNPTTGGYTLIADNIAHTGTRTFTPPGDNGSSFHDWVLALDPATGGTNAPPTVATPAAANPASVTAKAAALTVLGADDGGEASLTYTWSATGPATVTFSANASNAAKSSVATFNKAGSYSIQALITDTGGATTSSSLAVTVAATLTALMVSPATAQVAVNATQAFTVAASDQFGASMTAPAVTWTLSGGGSVSPAGVLTAGGAAGGPFVVKAASGSISATASMTVTAASTSLTIGVNSVLANDDANNGGWLIAQPASLPQTATVQTLSIYVGAAAGLVRLGLYDASGPNGGPGVKKAETAEVTPVVGWNTVNVLSPVVLAAGTYWLAYLPSTDSFHTKVAGSASCVYYQIGYGPLPAVFSTTPTADTAHWSIYGTLTP